MYDDLAESFVFDKETIKRIKDVNLYAMLAILVHPQESAERELWDADPCLSKSSRTRDHGNRVENYRILAEIHDNVLVILLIDIGHCCIVHDR